MQNDRAKAFGQWVMAGVIVGAGIIIWFGAERYGPALGSDLATALGLFIGLFAIAGATKAAEHAEYWYAGKYGRR